MVTATDFVLESSATNAVLFVEAKNTESPSSDWAARFASNLFEHMRLRPNQYLLLALRNKFYLWKHVPAPGAELPDFEARTEDVLQPYLARIQTSLNELSPANFDLLVRSWLADLTEGAVAPNVAEWVRISGLGEFEHATIREEVAN